MSDERDIRELLEPYLDGELGEAEGARFERTLDEDGSLRDELALQERIDESLRRIVSPEAVRVPPPKRRSSRGRLIAAVLLLGLSAVLVVTRFTGGPIDLRSDGALLYERRVERGFLPRTVCTSDEQFLEYMDESYGVALLSRATPGVELLGWDYATGSSGKPLGLLLVRVEGEPVLVVMDTAERDQNVRLARSSGLNLFRRRVGGIVLHEVTPMDAPKVLETFYVPTD